MRTFKQREMPDGDVWHRLLSESVSERLVATVQCSGSPLIPSTRNHT